MDALSGIRFGPVIAAAATRHGLDPRLLAAVAAQETGGPGSDSGANIVGDYGHGHGLFQIDDRYHAFAQTPGALDPAQNAEFAAGLLSGLLDRYGGDVHAALSAYNAGSPDARGTVTPWPDGERLGYADSVLRHLTSIQTRTGAAGAPVALGTPMGAPLGVDGGAAGAGGPNAGAGAPGAGATSTALPPAVLEMMASLVPQISSTVPPLAPFRSYASDLQSGGGSIGDDADRRMAGLIGTGSGDGPDGAQETA